MGRTVEVYECMNCGLEVEVFCDENHEPDIIHPACGIMEKIDEKIKKKEF